MIRLYLVKHEYPGSFFETSTDTYHITTQRDLQEEDKDKLIEELVGKLQLDFDPDKDGIEFEKIATFFSDEMTRDILTNDILAI